MFRKPAAVVALMAAMTLTACSGSGAMRPETAGSAEAKAQSFVPKPAPSVSPTCNGSEKLDRQPSDDENALMANDFCLFRSFATDAQPPRPQGRVEIGLWTSSAGTKAVVTNGELNSVTSGATYCIIPWGKALPSGLSSTEKVRRVLQRVAAPWSPTDFTMHADEKDPSWRDGLVVCRQGSPEGSPAKSA